MRAFILRHKTGISFLATVIVLVSIVAGQVPAGEGNSLLVWTIYTVVSPLQHGVAYVAIGARELWDGYVDLGGVHAENEELRRELVRLNRENQSLRERVAQAGARYELAAFQHVFESSSGSRTLTAIVIGAGVEEGGDTFLLNRGTLDGVEPDLGVICPTGIVGKVIRVGPTTCLVQLLTDPRFAMAARVQRNRVRGILHGTGNPACELRYLRDTDPISEGDLIVSSGMEGIFPRGVLIGRVERVEPGEPPFRSVGVLPSTEFRSLEWVLVVMGAGAGDDGGREDAGD